MKAYAEMLSIHYPAGVIPVSQVTHHNSRVSPVHAPDGVFVGLGAKTESQKV